MLPDGRSCGATYKVLLAGDQGVGKTAILNSLAGKQFKGTMLPTVGVDFVRQIFEVDGALIQLLIWDSPGYERLRSITQQQFKGIQGLVLVYDVTKDASYDTLKYWMGVAQRQDTGPHKGGYEPVPTMLCGNKCDLLADKKTRCPKGQKFSQQHMAFGFYQTSARTGENVHPLFQSLAYHITDICDPQLMRSYHPYSITPTSEPAPDVPEVKTLRKFMGKKKATDKISKGRAEVFLRPEKIESSKYGNSVCRVVASSTPERKIEADVNVNKMFRWCVCACTPCELDEGNLATGTSQSS